MVKRRQHILLSCVLCAVPISTCLGSGADGHMIVGDIAWHRLDDQAKVAVREILGSETRAYAATWADRVRSDEDCDWIKPYH